MKIKVEPHRLGDGPSAWYGVRYEVEDRGVVLNGTARNEWAALRQVVRRVNRYRKAARRLERIQRR